VADVLQHGVDDAAHILLVVDDEDASHGRFQPFLRRNAITGGPRPIAARAATSSLASSLERFTISRAAC